MTTTPFPSPSHSVSSYTARSPEDLLALAPVVLGFEPSDSVVMLTFGAAQQFHARIDLPDRASALVQVAAALLDPAQRHEVAAVALLVYTDDARLANAAWRALRGGCSARGIDVVTCLRADGRRWYPLTGPDVRRRDTGVAYDVGAHPFRARAVVEGRVAHASRDELAGTVAASPDRVARVVDEVVRAPRPVPTTPAGLLAEGTWVEGLVRRHLAGSTSPSDAEVARLLQGLVAIPVRDAAWSCLPSTVAREAVALWSDVVRRAPSELLAAPGALLAWSAWQSGDGALAWCALDRVAEVAPDYSLAALLGSCLTGAVPPSTMDPVLAWRHDVEADDPTPGR